MISRPRKEPRPLEDNPDRLGPLAPVFLRRRIAMAVDGEGQLVLVRPDSGLIDVGDDDEAFREIVARIEDLDTGGRIVVELPDERRRPLSGIIRFSIPGVDDEVLAGERRYTVHALNEALAFLRGAGFDAAANHVLLASQGVIGNPVGAEANYAGGMMFTAEVRTSDDGEVFLCSTSAPAPEPAPYASRLDLDGHDRPQVLVLDTGLCTTVKKGVRLVEHERLRGIVHVPGGAWIDRPVVEAVDDEDEPDDDGGGYLDFEGGHGTFISGIVRQLCPDADVYTAGVLSSFGDGDVTTVAAAYERILEVAGPFDVVVMSFGGYMTDDDGAIFERALARLIGDGLGVSAAGNQATSRPYFPAAFADIVGVGALGEDGKAWFTNFGGWVDACAPGIDVVSTFFTSFRERPFRDEGGPAGDTRAGRVYTGYARWSGTSFAAPKVAALVAQEAYLTRTSARDAWHRLSHHSRYRYPDLGTVFNA